MKEQRIRNADLYRRIVDTVDKALATAPQRVFTKAEEGFGERTYCCWTFRTTSDLTATKWDDGLRELQLRVADDINARLDLSTHPDEPEVVRWWPGLGEAKAEDFLAQWERLVERTASGDIEEAP